MRAEQTEVVRLDGRDVKITRPGKILFPEDGITKGDLIRYYARIGARMVPFLAERPLSMQRYPDGIGGPTFFQKSAGAYYPRWIPRATMKKVGGSVEHVVCNDVATLVYLANQACITLHPWLSRAGRPDFPDQMIFDFDPSTSDIRAVVSGALAARQILDELELPAFLKSTGSRGLHVVVPLDGKQNFAEVREFARSVAEKIVADDPAAYTLEQYKVKRRGRVFVDINRNAYAQTAAAVYTVRARPGAPVSAPLDWEELKDRKFRADGVTIRNLFERLDGMPDPWQGFWRRKGSVARARRKMER
jgi:bifunctional non-homologous end joining protein LigD